MMLEVQIRLDALMSSSVTAPLKLIAVPATKLVAVGELIVTTGAVLAPAVHTAGTANDCRDGDIATEKPTLLNAVGAFADAEAGEGFPDDTFIRLRL